MSAVSVERYDDFTGGLNLRADQFQLAKNESPDMLNVEIDPRGGLFSRGAMREINTTAISGSWTPQKLFAFQGDTPTIMLSTQSKVYKSTGANFSTLQYSAGNDVAPTTSHGVCFAQWGKTLYMATGYSGAGGYKWQTTDTYATALTASGSNPNAWQAYNTPTGGKMPTAEHLVVHANKMFAANTTENAVRYPNRVRWSHENLPEDWLADDYIDFEGGSDGVTAIASVNGQLVVFKSSSIYVVYGYDSTDFQVVELTSQLGATTHEHVATAENGVYFYAHQRGLYFYNGTQVVDLTDNLKGMFDEGYVNNSEQDEISLSYVNRRVWLSLPYSKTTSVNYPSTSFVYDPSIGRGAWVAHRIADGYAPVSGCNFRKTDGSYMYLMVHPNIPRVLQVDIYSEEKDLLAGVETGFESYYRTGWVDGRTYSSKKMFRRPDIIVKQVDTQRSINVKVYHNYEEAIGNERKNFNILLLASARGMVWGSGYWGTGEWGVVAQGAQVVRGTNLGLARSVQLLFTGPVGLYWGIDSIAYKFNNRKISG
jgi:hypothetical protein